MKIMSLLDDLKNKKKYLGIWGLGYIGFSSMAHFARQGIKCIGTDIDPVKVNAVNIGKSIMPNLESWLGFPVEPLVKAGLMQATTDWTELINNKVPVHLICVPTEKYDEPFDDCLIDVIKKLCNFKNIKTDYPPLIIIESTITPDRVDSIVFPILREAGFSVGKDILVGVAPRRDWFAEPDKTLKTLPRVVGGSTPETTELMAEVLGLVCDKILKATDHVHAAIVKSVENTYRCVEIQLANELSLAYPHINIVEVLKWAGTKWNMGTYHPSVGIGGYCIPLAPKYILSGARNPKELQILNATIKSYKAQPIKVVKNLIKRGVKNIGILGLAYKGDLKVHTLSPTLTIVKELKKHGIKVKVHDPYYTAEEIKKILDVETFSYPEGMKEFDAIVIVADHILYRGTPSDDVLNNLKNCKLIIDNMGAWNKIDFSKRKIEYHEAGDKNWII